MISLRHLAFILGCLMSVPTVNAEVEVSSNSLPGNASVILNRIINHYRVPGMAAVVLKGNEIVAEGTAGLRKAGATNQLEIDDQFLLCSGTKAMTATLIAMAVEEGKLSYSTTLDELFSSDTKTMDPGWRKVTVEQLLEHRAGVPTEGERLWILLRIHFSKRITAEKRNAIVERILLRPPSCTPGTKYVYTALDYIMLGVILEDIYGSSWEDLIQQKLWQPLGITTGGFGAPGTAKLIDEPQGHWGMVFTGCPIAPDGFWSRLSMPLFFGPAGSVHMSITDWAKFISLHLCGDPANPNHQERLLKTDSFVQLHRADPGMSYQGGWYVGTRSWAKGSRPGDTGQVIASLGDNGFWHAEAWVAPELDSSVIVICNQGGTGKKPASLACNDANSELIKDYLHNQ